MRRVKIFDTTLRDGEQAPGFGMTVREKIEIASYLEAMRVDVIEAGFAIVSDSDFESVREISKRTKNASVASLCRATKIDIDRAYEALKSAQDPLIHIVIATSDIHMKYKLNMSEDEVLARAAESVKYAKGLCPNVQFSCEDASRSNKDFLVKVARTVIDAGAGVFSLPDTVGYLTPMETFELFSYLRKNVPELSEIGLSIHCHNDLGLAVANSLAAAQAGATQIDGTLNGIGERAGNAALEEIIMNVKTRPERYDFEINVDTTKIYQASRALSLVTGVPIPKNKAIVGGNAFSHESGIHQHGVLKNRSTYEIIDPVEIGFVSPQLVLGKHSGKHALEDYLRQKGIELGESQLERFFRHFKTIADKKESVSERDMDAMLREHFARLEEVYSLEEFIITTGNTIKTHAKVSLKVKDNGTLSEISEGDGPVNAAYNAILKIFKEDVRLLEYRTEAVTGGTDALGEVKVCIEKDGASYRGRGLSTDIIEASILAYINALNHLQGAKADRRIEKRSYEKN